MPPQRPFQQKRINGRVRSITEMAGHSSALGDRDTADRMQRAGIAPYAGMHGAASRTRADNIAAARADGTFDAKRNAFNSANKGSYMDEAGRIGPRAPGTGGATASTTATSFVSAPDGQGGSKQVKIQTPGGVVSAASSPKPAVKATTSPAMPTGIGMVDAVTKQVSTRPDRPAASQSSGFTSMPPGSRDLYAEEKARNAKATSMVAAASAPDPLMKQAQALGNAAKIAKSPETAAVVAKAKASLPKTGMVAAASPRGSGPKQSVVEPLGQLPATFRSDLVGDGKMTVNDLPSSASSRSREISPLLPQGQPAAPKAPAVAAQAQATIPKSAATTKPTPQEMGKKLIATATPDQWDQAANKPENDLKQAEADAIAGRMARMGAVEKGARAVASAGDTVLNTAGDAVKGVGAMVSAVRTGFPKVVSDIQTSVRKSVMGDSNESPAEKRFREMQEANNKAPAKKESAPVTSPIISRAPSTPPLQPRKKVVAARAKGGPVTAGKPYLVGEKGPEIIVPKNSGMVIPNHKITPPALDKLANQGKMATLPHARTPASIVSAASAGSQPSDPQAGQKWLDKWDEKVASKEEAARDEDVVREEKRLGLPSLKKLRTGKPQNQWEEVKVGLEEGVTKIGQTVAGIGSMVNLPGAETRRKMYADRASTMESYRKRGAPDVGLSAGDIASSAVKEAPEWVNPFSAPGKIAKAGNAVYHAVRSYAPNKSYIDAAMGSASNVIGEKAEDLVTKGKGLFGNAIGSVIENGTNYVRGEEKPKKRKGPFMSAASN